MDVPSGIMDDNSVGQGMDWDAMWILEGCDVCCGCLSTRFAFWVGVWAAGAVWDLGIGGACVCFEVCRC